VTADTGGICNIRHYPSSIPEYIVQGWCIGTVQSRAAFTRDLKGQNPYVIARSRLQRPYTYRAMFILQQLLGEGVHFSILPRLWGKEYV